MTDHTVYTASNTDDLEVIFTGSLSVCRKIAQQRSHAGLRTRIHRVTNDGRALLVAAIGARRVKTDDDFGPSAEQEQAAEEALADVKRAQAAGEAPEDVDPGDLLDL